MTGGCNVFLHAGSREPLYTLYRFSLFPQTEMNPSLSRTLAPPNSRPAAGDAFVHFPPLWGKIVMHSKTKAVIPSRLSAHGVPGEDLSPSPCTYNPKPRPPQGPWDPGSRWDANTDAGSGLFPKTELKSLEAAGGSCTAAFLEELLLDCSTKLYQETDHDNWKMTRRRNYTLHCVMLKKTNSKMH